ncbi:MAG: hypothetical protein IJS86_01320 [Lachnospiraceae bacterium]|nr:hypothetical protein [Lachnospiraceae bacterium]
MKISVKTEKYDKTLMFLSKDFSSGNGFLDQFIKSEDALNESLGKTFVWIDDKRTHIIGYYNIGVGYIDMISGNEKYKIGGSIHLNFFALNERYRGIIVGETQDGNSIKISDRLFADFMSKVYEIRDRYLGFAFVTLAATEEGYSLYKRNFFDDLDEDLHFSFKDDEKGCKPMYLAVDS